MTNKRKEYLDSLYIRIDGEVYKKSGIIKSIGSAINGNELYENMLKEETGGQRSLIGGKFNGFDITSPKRLNELLCCIGGKKGKVAGHFILHRDGYNVTKATLSMISKAVGVSLPTINNVVRELKAADFLRSRSRGEYMVSPYLIHRGKVARAIYLGKMYDQLPVFDSRKKMIDHMEE